LACEKTGARPLEKPSSFFFFFFFFFFFYSLSRFGFHPPSGSLSFSFEDGFSLFQERGNSSNKTHTLPFLRFLGPAFSFLDSLPVRGFCLIWSGRGILITGPFCSFFFTQALFFTKDFSYWCLGSPGHKQLVCFLLRFLKPNG